MVTLKEFRICQLSNFLTLSIYNDKQVLIYNTVKGVHSYKFLLATIGWSLRVIRIMWLLNKVI